MKAKLNAKVGAVKKMYQKAVGAVSRTFALGWHQFYWARYRFSILKAKHSAIAIWILITLLVLISAYFSPVLQNLLEPHLSEQNKLNDLQSLFLNIGSALIGAAAIAFSLVMFAMQVNVERMPHGLFRRLSTDIRIIVSFAGIFLLAISIACASLISDTSWAAVAILGSAWGISLILMLFLYAYRRALALINPLKQLNLVIKDSNREMRVWVRRAKRAAPLFQSTDTAPGTDADPSGTSFDTSRAAYFLANPHWTAGAQKAIQYAISLARRYAEQGDHEVSDAALRAVVVINRNYVEAKGQTFFHNPLVIDNPLSTDRFINDTLELLRQNTRLGVSRGDEQQIEQSLQTLAELIGVYIAIDYSNRYASKTHAIIAAGYLSEAVKSVIPHQMADVLMEGVRLMGQSAHFFLERNEPNSITTLTEEIGLIACTGVANEKYRPVTLTAIEQLAKLTFALIRSNAHDIHFLVDHLKENVTMVTKLFLKVPDTPLVSAHSTYLAPYYSSTTTQSLLSWLTELANAIVEANPENEGARTAVQHIEDWADGLYQAQKELLLLAIEKRSHFTFDMIHWISRMTQILLALSNSPVCNDHIRDELRKHALWLISTVSWIPDDKETVAFVESFQLTETLFEIAIDAYQRECFEVFEKLQGLLMGWAFKGGRQQTGWGILERSFYGLATLALIANSQAVENLKRQIADRLSRADAPDQEIRGRTAYNIRRKAEERYRQDYRYSKIEYEMSQIEQTKMESLLEELANLLSPNKSDEPIGSTDKKAEGDIDN
ncbi:MAG: hypothetical protein M1147_05830 [Nitrospirae bacterium]|nr:hypothetical protein [Nitrospirota bacterium]MCL5977637.1 hypothetical protein [Nitrospirota bacterium]